MFVGTRIPSLRERLRQATINAAHRAREGRNAAPSERRMIEHLERRGYPVVRTGERDALPRAA